MLLNRLEIYMNLFNLIFFSIINNSNNSCSSENNSNNFNYSNFNNSPKKPLPKKVFNYLDNTKIVKSYRD